jgi:hypothetical protein
VAAVTRRLIEGLLETGTIVPVSVAKAFDNKRAIGVARGKLQSRLTNGDGDVPIGHSVIRAYLGQGNPEHSYRAERQIREAIVALKQSGKYFAMTLTTPSIRQPALPKELIASRSSLDSLPTMSGKLVREHHRCNSARRLQNRS